MAKPTESTARLETFSDGVFAVAITLLVLGLHVSAKTGQLGAGLAKEWPHFATYVVSFLTIGIIWMNHHAQFERVVRADRTLMVLNLILLMFVTLIPFPTSLLASHFSSGSDQQVATALYAATLLAMSLAFFSTFVWSAHAKLFGTWVAPHTSYLLRRNGTGMLAYVAAIGLAFVSAGVSLAICAGVAIYYLIPGRTPPDASD
jgi:uncharacterized membrane protein